MPPTDESADPQASAGGTSRSPRRSLGRGPGTDRGGPASPARPVPGSGGEPPGPRRPLPDGGQGAASGAPEAPGERPAGEPDRGPEAPAEASAVGQAAAAESAGASVTAAEPEAAAPEVVGGTARGEPETAAEDAAVGRAAGAAAEYTGGEPPDPRGGQGAASGAPEVPAGRPAGGHERGPEAAAQDAAEPATAREGDVVDDGRFKVRLANFEGPFDLLLQLIAKHKLDVTEVALSKVTDEFMQHIRAMGNDWDLDQTTEFLVVAATLLDLKAARLLPSAEVEDEADLALLEARDLLFARLLQYRAYKQIAEIFSARLEEEGKRYPRTVGLEPQHAELLPEVVISIGAEGFAKLAVKAMQPKPKPQVYVDHIHAPLVSVREQAEVVVALLRERGQATFRELVEGAGDTLTVVARFLALLELYREKAVALDQEDALGELLVKWTGGEQGATVTDEFDQEVRESQEEGNE
ncbi:segregation/condensation protein A [Streptomyces sp. NPDC023998]|uniref:segregation and condensation protein A n=1 Tax=Streptomyces sp. NPDC023998 TaxID=3154597 RepID=UPI0033C068B9